MNLKHVVKEETKEVLVVCDSAITAMGVRAWAKKYYPGYTPKIISKQTFEGLGQS